MVTRILRPLRSLVSTSQGWVILIVVVSQLLIPLRYYMRRRDPHDERFAWRMFSPIRMVQCIPEVDIDGQRLALDTKCHEAWIEIAKRGRFVVLEAMAAELCAAHPGRRVELRLTCTYVGGNTQQYGGYDMCSVPLL